MSTDEKRFSELLETILNRAQSREAARYALAQLFPKVEKELRAWVPHETQERNERKRQRRMSERDYAPAYFRLDPQPAAWGHSEIETILETDNPANALVMVEGRIGAAQETDRPRLRRLFLETLDGAFGIERPFNLSWFQALIDVSPYYIAARDEVQQFLFTIENFDRLRWVLIHALEELLPENRAGLILAVIPQSRDISVLCDLVRSMVGDQRPDGAKNERESARLGDLAHKVRNELVAQVQLFARTNQIWSQSLPDNIL